MLLACCAILMFIVQTLSLKQARNAGGDEDRGSMYKLSAAYTFIITIAFGMFWLTTGEAAVHTATVVIGIGYGIVFFLTMLFYSYAMSTGPLSYAAFYFSASLLLPVIASVVLWNDPLTIMKSVGIILFIVSFYFINVFGNKGQSSSGTKWLVYCFLAFVFNGSLPIVMKWQQLELDGQELIPFMTVGFGSAFLYSVIGWLIVGRLQRRTQSIRSAVSTSAGRRPRLLFLYIVSIAAATGIGNAIMTYLSGRMSGLLLFPLVNGSMIVLLTMLSAWLYKEKLSRGGIIGIAIGLIAIILVNR